MLTIRLARVGKKKQPQYRVVVADHRRAVTGRFVDVVGHVNPLTDPATVTLKNDKVTDWLSKGARPSETVQTILIRENVIKAPAKQAKRATKAAKNPDKYGKAASAELTPAPDSEAPAESPETDEQAAPADESAPDNAETAVEAEAPAGGDEEVAEAPVEEPTSPTAAPETDGQVGEA